MPIMVIVARTTNCWKNRNPTHSRARRSLSRRSDAGFVAATIRTLPDDSACGRGDCTDLAANCSAYRCADQQAPTVSPAAEFGKMATAETADILQGIFLLCDQTSLLRLFLCHRTKISFCHPYYTLYTVANSYFKSD